MIRATDIVLLGEDPHGVFENTTMSERTVPAEIKSVTMREFYLARNDGIEPEIVFKLADYADYQGEKLLIHDGVVYDVIRSYTPEKGQTIDIVCKRREKNG